ncbi:unnamed protein product [Rotaria sordida]|uniref:Uncharacterized protein n=1 Tax=Rotaria sordida TaxID=392033 RepID=A0A814BC57_9BILA|nr:unnamed protein product [Rotaria sordida]
MDKIAIYLFGVLMIVRLIEGGCGCEGWCQKNGKQYGICGDGHTCICSSKPITDPEQGCGCGTWCRKEGYAGGICGDGHTCICSSKSDKKNDEYVRGQYKLTIINNIGNDLNEMMRQSIIDAYFQIYPQIQLRFNKRARKDVQIKIDPNYDGIAYASNGEIVISGTHLKNDPRPTGVLTHEMMHIVQSYPGGQPEWLVEGIADYVRWKYGQDKVGGGWQLSDFNLKQHYTNSYRVTARFLVWLERKVQNNIVNRLDQGLRQNQYENGKLWIQISGKSVDQLWNDYTNDSRI